MKFEDMKLTYGYPMQLQTSGISGQPERYSCRLIGCLPGRSVLLSVPKMGGKLVRFRTGQKVVARLMVDNGIGIFAGIVETQTADPYPILHIGYPENVNFKAIRSATRVAIEQPIAITNLTAGGEQATQGAIVDISVSGARIETSAEVGDIGDKVELSLQVNIVGIIRDLSVEAILRSRVEPEPQAASHSEMITYGIQFIEADEDRRLLLYAYVYSQLGSEDVVS